MESLTSLCMKSTFKINNDDKQKGFKEITKEIHSLWQKNLRHNLSIDHVMSNLDTQKYDKDLIHKVFNYMERCCMINFGFYGKEEEDDDMSSNSYDERSFPISLPKINKKIIIIGAGISGVIAAQQLSNWGYDVKILEARDRVGGRIATYHHRNFLADLGASLLKHGNANIETICSQIGSNIIPLNMNCPLYEKKNTMINKEKDIVFREEFGKMLKTAKKFTELDIHDSNLINELSLEDAIQIIINCQEKLSKEKQIVYLNEKAEYQKQFIACLEKLTETTVHLNDLSMLLQSSLGKSFMQSAKSSSVSELLPLYENFVSNLPLNKINQYKKSINKLRECYKQYLNQNDLKNELESKLDYMEKNPPGNFYLSYRDQNIIDWHLANLEHCNSCNLSNLSIDYFKAEDTLADTYFSVENGLASIPFTLARGLDVKYHTAIQKITYNTKGVAVECVEVNTLGSSDSRTDTPCSELGGGLELSNLHYDSEANQESFSNESSEIFTCDAVLCTLPLGVLKTSLDNSLPKTFTTGTELPPADINVVKFEPELPSWKADAVKRLGFGVFNKVVICFDKVFWDPAVQVFGHVNNSTPDGRGEFFRFYTISKTVPVIVAILAGQAAEILEKVNDDIIIARCLTVLKRLYGNENVPPAKEYVVTRWKADVWSKGSQSYLAVGSKPEDYDILAQPLETEDGVKRVFFAGEHTYKDRPGTVEGALLSGLREATRIANQFSPLQNIENDL